MKDYSIQERAEFYNKAFPKYPPLVYTDRWLYGIWIIGAYYKNKTDFYGAYPHSYLKRIMSMFPDAEEVLHLFSGSLTDDVGGDRLDINPNLNPNIVGNAEELSSLMKKKYDLILADPPYTKSDQERYSELMGRELKFPNRNKVVRECTMVLEEGGYLVWLDQVLPMYRKKDIELVGTIGLIRSTNHRFRVISIFRKR